MIEVCNLWKSFGGNVLFEDYNMHIETGEYVIIAGRSGSGKTTLLNMLGSLEPVDAGTILVDGLDISTRKDQLTFFKNKVGFIFQNFVLVEDKTVKQNLEIIKLSNRSQISIPEALSRVGLEDKTDHKVYTLSGGEQQRIALARLMIKKCDLILADEPTGSLDRRNANQVMETLAEMNKEGRTVVVVTHDERLFSMGNRVVDLC